jgi:glutamine amidotransferase
MSSIAIVDLGIGNLRSVEHALSHVSPSDAQVLITSDPAEIESCDRMVLPGQGAIGSWFAAYREKGVGDAVSEALAAKPCLGICIGQQALFDRSDEDGGIDGLGLFPGEVKHFRDFQDGDAGLKIPHMGWNTVRQVVEHPLWHEIENGARFYFVHSYCANAKNPVNELGVTDYGHKFSAAVGAANVFAVQFHPEKSQVDGLQLLRNFVSWDGQA